MKKYYLLLSMALLAVLSFSFTSCSDDDDDDEKSGSFAGYYTNVDKFSKDIQEDIEKNFVDDDGFLEGRLGYNFTNSNTVEKVQIWAYAKPKSNPICTKNISGKTVYFVKEKSYGLYSFTIKDNSIYITDGSIGTISDNSFYIEGQRFSKLN